jgi:hypothetical protein
VLAQELITLHFTKTKKSDTKLTKDPFAAQDMAITVGEEACGTLA